MYESNTQPCSPNDPGVAKAKASIPSPCIGLCEMNDAGYCLGCARNSFEIGMWRDGAEVWRRSVWKALPKRLDALGVTVRRLRTSGADILDFIEDSLNEAAGTWVLGVYGGVGEFNRDPEEPVAIARGADEIVAVTDRAALRLRAPRTARLLAIGGGRGRDAPPRAYCLATQVERVSLPVTDVLTGLGADTAAIRPDDRGAAIFDVGLGRDKARFCVRSGDPDVLNVLRAAEGSPLRDLFARAGPTLLRHSPTRVVETGLGRVEVDTPIPPPGGASPPGPHTHLLPDHLAQGVDVPPGLAIPEAYAVGAVFYPKGGEPID
jgi:predicted Fe-S protein YdhL (DUF1289 family)